MDGRWLWGGVGWAVECPETIRAWLSLLCLWGRLGRVWHPPRQDPRRSRETWEHHAKRVEGECDTAGLETDCDALRVVHRLWSACWRFRTTWFLCPHCASLCLQGHMQTCGECKPEQRIRDRLPRLLCKAQHAEQDLACYRFSVLMPWVNTQVNWFCFMKTVFSGQNIVINLPLLYRRFITLDRFAL